MSSLKDFYIINPYSKVDIRILKEYCYKHNQQVLYDKVISINETMSEENYLMLKGSQPVIEELYYQRDETEITSIAKVTVAKDIKSAQIEFFQTNRNIKNLIIDLSQYLLQNSNLENIFIFINRNDKKTMHNLIENDFMPLISEGKNEEFIPFMLEKVIDKEREIHI